MSTEFVPVIVGTDINTYLTSVCFHEEYGVKPYLLGRDTLGPTQYSSLFAHIKYDGRIDEPEGLVNALREYAHEIPHKGRPLLLMGTSDKYIRLMVENRDSLKDLYRMNIPDPAVNSALQDKKSFYQLAASHDLPIPQTHFHRIGEPLELDIERYPVILKPSNGIEYFNNMFEGQEKVYKIADEHELLRVIRTISESGYRDDVIIQDYIPGDDTLMWDSVLYLNTEGSAELVTFGQVALQEHVVSAVGNYTAVLARYDEPMMTQLAQFLESVGYTGFANADLKYDVRDGQYKVLEFNTRQGRSSFYATQLGHNLARYIVEDVVEGSRKELQYARGEALFTVVPHSILRRYVKNKDLLEEIRKLKRENKSRNPLWYHADKSLKRFAFLLMRNYRYAKKYATATWERPDF